MGHCSKQLTRLRGLRGLREGLKESTCGSDGDEEAGVKNGLGSDGDERELLSDEDAETSGK